LFPERGASTLKAKAMCAACMVKEVCLEFALTEVERFGLGGGLPERERRKIRGQRTREEKRA
jgi:WhiB family redox-sensing transcriptional regulator